MVDEIKPAIPALVEPAKAIPDAPAIAPAPPISTPAPAVTK